MIDATNAQAEKTGHAKLDFFEAVDKDKDGFVTPEEMDAYFEAQGLGNDLGSTNAGAAKKSARTSSQSNGDGMEAMMFKSLDKNGDGVVNRREVRRSQPQSPADP